VDAAVVIGVVVGVVFALVAVLEVVGSTDAMTGFVVLLAAGIL
jgi:hypothetical protein